jgi:hypothetical protein
MAPLTRILSLVAAGALVAFTSGSIPARSDDSAQNLGAVGPHEPSATECHLLRRAMSRRACQARLWRGLHIDTAENE